MCTDSNPVCLLDMLRVMSNASSHHTNTNRQRAVHSCLGGMRSDEDGINDRKGHPAACGKRTVHVGMPTRHAAQLMNAKLDEHKLRQT